MSPVMPAVPSTFDQARTCHQAGDFRRAEQLYRQVVQAESQHAQAWKLLADVLHAQKNLPEAAASYRRALEIRPDDAGALFGLASVLAEQGQRDQAADLYRQLLR